MNILYVGDVMGEVGIETVEKFLPALKKKHQIDLVIVQAENVTEGKGLKKADYERLKSIGVSGFTGGNHTLFYEETTELLDDDSVAVTRPANYPEGTPGKSYKILETDQGKVLLISLLGSIVGKDADRPMQNPLTCVDNILSTLHISDFAGVIVNFHGDYSSEKVVIGHYLDGRVTAVIGDHWHVPTADARVLSGGTAHITDVGMTGILNSSLGIKYENIVARWRDNLTVKNILETKGPRQFNAVLVSTKPDSIRADSIEQISRVI